MRERIFLTYTNASSLPYHGAILGHHVVLNYINANGDHYTLEGVPERKFDRNAGKSVAFLQEEQFSDGVRNTDSPFRRLRARHEESAGGAALEKQHTMIASDDDLSRQWNRMKEFGEKVNATGYEYRPLSHPKASVFDSGAPAVPFITSDESIVPKSSTSLADRFANWNASASVSAPRAAYSLSPSPNNAPPGIVTGQPKPDLPFPVPFVNPSKSPSGPDETMDDFLFSLLRFRR